MRRLRICLAVSILLALAASFIALAQQSMAFFNTDIAQVMQQNLWQVTLIGSRFGDIWVLRLALLVFCAALLFTAEYFRALMPQLAEGLWRGLPWLGALFIGLTMIAGHAAGSTLLPWVAIAVDWLHALTVAFWLGGALTLTLLLPGGAGALRWRAEASGAAGSPAAFFKNHAAAGGAGHRQRRLQCPEFHK